METLRVELQPFGVNVLSVVNGVVKSNAQNWKHFEDWKLPENSIYKPLEELIHQRIQEKDGVYSDGIARVDTMQHAKKLVAKILKGATGTVWCGGQAGGVKFATTYLPQFALVSLEMHPNPFLVGLKSMVGQDAFCRMWAGEAWEQGHGIGFLISHFLSLAARGFGNVVASCRMKLEELWYSM